MNSLRDFAYYEYNSKAKTDLHSPLFVSHQIDVKTNTRQQQDLFL